MLLLDNDLSFAPSEALQRELYICHLSYKSTHAHTTLIQTMCYSVFVKVTHIEGKFGEHYIWRIGQNVIGNLAFYYGLAVA